MWRHQCCFCEPKIKTLIAKVRLLLLEVSRSPSLVINTPLSWTTRQWGAYWAVEDVAFSITLVMTLVFVAVFCIGSISHFSIFRTSSAKPTGQVKWGLFSEDIETWLRSKGRKVEKCCLNYQWSTAFQAECLCLPLLFQVRKRQEDRTSRAKPLSLDDRSSSCANGFVSRDSFVAHRRLFP